MSRKTGVYISCEMCGKEKYKTQSQHKKAKHHFCSNDCSAKFRSIKSRKIRKCELCSGSFRVIKSSPQKLCSVKCQHEWQKTQVGELNSRYNRIVRSCGNCGKELYIILANYKRYEESFCDNDCRQNWFANVLSQSDEWIETSRKRAVKLLKNNKPTTETKPQIIINNLLDEMDIEYENERGYKYYSVDNYLIDYNLIIEVMGDYWHTNPLKYNVIKQEQQLRAIPRDRAKRNYIKKHYNIEILYLWENDILNHIDLCKYLIEEYIKMNGELSNYHSFNYSINENKLVLHSEIIKPFQDMKKSEYKDKVAI